MIKELENEIYGEWPQEQETILPRQEKRPKGDLITVFNHCYSTEDGDQMVSISTKERILKLDISCSIRKVVQF